MRSKILGISGVCGERYKYDLNIELTHSMAFNGFIIYGEIKDHFNKLYTQAQLTVVFVEKLWLQLKKTIDIPVDFDSKLGETLGLTASRCTLVKDTSGNVGKY